MELTPEQRRQVYEEEAARLGVVAEPIPEKRGHKLRPHIRTSTLVAAGACLLVCIGIAVAYLACPARIVTFDDSLVFDKELARTNWVQAGADCGLVLDKAGLGLMTKEDLYTFAHSGKLIQEMENRSGWHLAKGDLVELVASYENLATVTWKQQGSTLRTLYGFTYEFARSPKAVLHYYFDHARWFE